MISDVRNTTTLSVTNTNAIVCPLSKHCTVMRCKYDDDLDLLLSRVELDGLAPNLPPLLSRHRPPLAESSGNMQLHDANSHRHACSELGPLAPPITYSSTECHRINRSVNNLPKHRPTFPAKTSYSDLRFIQPLALRTPWKMLLWPTPMTPAPPHNRPTTRTSAFRTKLCHRACQHPVDTCINVALPAL